MQSTVKTLKVYSDSKQCNPYFYRVAARKTGLALISWLEAERQVSTAWVEQPHQNLN
jgi:hypothetical protein